MEIFSTPWWSALLAIVLIDLVLAGDNAIVIALAARNLPPHLQKKAAETTFLLTICAFNVDEIDTWSQSYKRNEV